MIEYSDGKIDETKIRPSKSYGDYVFCMILCFFLPTIFLIIDIYAIYHFSDFSIADKIRVVIGMGFCSFLVAFLLYGRYICYKLRYEIHTYGIKEIQPFKRERIVLWDEFQEICICYTYTKMNFAYVVIAFVKKGAKRNWMKRWKTDGLFYYKKVIVMDYTEELLEQVKTFYHKDIPDLREKKEYKMLARVYHENKWLW